MILIVLAVLVDARLLVMLHVKMPVKLVVKALARQLV